MRISFGAFTNKVAWRVFARFVVASLVPLAALAAVFLFQINGAAERRALADLGDTSRAVGQLLLERLILVSDWLPSAQTLTDDDVHRIGISALRVESGNGTVARGPEFSPPRLRYGLSPYRPALVVDTTEPQPELVIARLAADEAIFARVDRDYLSSVAALAAGSVDVCVFADSLQNEPVFCTTSLTDSARAELEKRAGSGSAGNLTWSEGPETWLGAYWEVFTPSRFDAKPLVVFASMPRAAALESTSIFDKVAPQALALALLLALLLSASQIRRTLEPLSRLVSGTRRIAAQDFDVRMETSGNDEFDAVSRALNDMADQLGRQFGTLTTLAKIDQLILSLQSIDEVVEAVLILASDGWKLNEVAIYLAEPDDDRRGQLRRRRAGDSSSRTDRIEIPEEVRAELLAQPDGRLCVEPAARERIQPLTGWTGGAPVFVVPILRDDGLAGALLATTRLDAQPRDLGSLRELAIRLAVALAANEREKALFKRAHFDELTGIPNRQLCGDRLRQALAQARHDQHRVAVLFIDLDGFKSINDSQGHVAGDEVLKEMAFRLAAAVRDTDTIARFGGDEYVAILPGLQSMLEVEPVVTRVMAALQRPLSVGARESFISGSIGVTIFPEDGATAEELLRKADTAMYNAKTSGRSCCVYFTKEMDLRVQERLSLSGDLRRALERRELFVVYQPQISLVDGRVVCAEALLRWRHPTRGLIPPNLFIPILEENGLIEPVGAWVVRTALQDLAGWKSSGLAIPRVAVNVAARQLLSAEFATVVSDALRENGLTSEAIEIELTETTLVHDVEAANSRLTDLAARGIRISIDDFGTGYSSLGYLNELTFDALKVDRAFVVQLPSEKAMAIVTAIVAVAHALGKEVVAEGIEIGVQQVQLAQLGCDHGQGYLFSPPLEAHAFARWVTAHRPPRDERAAKKSA